MWLGKGLRVHDLFQMFVATLKTLHQKCVKQLEVLVNPVYACAVINRLPCNLQ